jgi:transposase
VTKPEPIRPPPLPGIFGVPGSSSRNAWERVSHKTRQKTGPAKAPAEQVVKEIRRATRRQFSAEDKIRVVLEGLRGEDSIAELCRREGIVQNLYYRWSKDFLEAGKKRLAGDTARAATSDEVKDLRREAGALKEVVAELTLENRLLKKSMIADGGDEA